MLNAAARCQPSMKIEGMAGECAPLGYFDPLGFSKDASPETMKKCVLPPRARAPTAAAAAAADVVASFVAVPVMDHGHCMPPYRFAMLPLTVVETQLVTGGFGCRRR